MQQVLDRKLADKDVINQGDATQIARAEAKLNDGQTPPNSISAKAQVCTSATTLYCFSPSVLVQASNKLALVSRFEYARLW